MCLLHKAELIADAAGMRWGAPGKDELWSQIETCSLPGYGRFEPAAPTLTTVTGTAKATRRRAKLAVARVR